MAIAIISIPISPELNIDALGLDRSGDRGSREYCNGCRCDESDLHHGASSFAVWIQRRWAKHRSIGVVLVLFSSRLIGGSILRLRSPCPLGSDAVKTKTYFAFRVDVWDGAGDTIVEHVAGVDDFETACMGASCPRKIMSQTPLAAALSPLGAFGGRATREHRIRDRNQRSERLQFPALRAPLN
jgi:hypothetical protein